VVVRVQVDWAIFDAARLWEAIHLWVGKKVRELLGEEEASLVKFIVDKVKGHTDPASLLEELEPVLVSQTIQHCTTQRSNTV
jgi:RNA-binding protein 25